ncbi:MAG: site-specific DNA-methyltransferase [Gammaproteobacteria bacterium]|nr:site-specific DNA-methyltransferase [Gammaproteobacteria bacterium]
MKYKEGFSSALVQKLIESANGKQVLDPFSGAGTTALTAMGMGLRGTGIEILPLGNLIAQSVAHAANGLSHEEFRAVSQKMLHATSKLNCNKQYILKHIPITEKAFSSQADREIANAREFIAKLDNPVLATVLNLACLSSLEEASYTRKDGQFLRWDSRSGRNVSAKLDKGEIPDFSTVLAARLREIEEDFSFLKEHYSGPNPTLITGSSLTELKKLPDNEYDCVVTSPPYANRYDYTRTYALELVYLDYDDSQVKALRQALLSATVENRSKRESLLATYQDAAEIHQVFRAVDEHPALQEVLSTLREHAEELSNRNIINLIENYFTEMALVTYELGRVVMPGGSVFMINDNVQYHGEEVPVDLILSDFAEQFGFHCNAIWILARGKGNSSQQMGKFGRKEIRKCVYHWVKVDG